MAQVRFLQQCYVEIMKAGTANCVAPERALAAKNGTSNNCKRGSVFSLRVMITNIRPVIGPGCTDAGKASSNRMVVDGLHCPPGAKGCYAYDGLWRVARPHLRLDLHPLTFPRPGADTRRRQRDRAQSADLGAQSFFQRVHVYFCCRSHPRRSIVGNNVRKNSGMRW